MISKEKVQLSEDTQERLRETAEKFRDIEKRIREARPESPDGFGEKGMYNERLSKLFGGRAVYETESGTAFFYNGIDEPQIVDEKYLERARSYKE